MSPPSSVGVRCFIAIPYRDELITTENTITKILRKYGIQYYIAKEDVTAGRDILCKICQNIFFSDFGIIETTYFNPNVMIEFGILLGKNKPVFLLLDESRTQASIPSDIAGLERIQYKNQETLSKTFEKGLRKFVQNINFEEKHLQNLIQQTKYYAQTGDYASLDSSLQIIYNKLVSKADEEDQFVNLLQELINYFISNGNLELSFRFGLAGIRIYLMKSKKEKALRLYDQIILDLKDFVVEAKKNADNSVRVSPGSLELSGYPLAFSDHWTYAFLNNDFNNPEIAEFYYAHLWYGLEHSNQPESWMRELIDLIGIDILKDPLSWSVLHRFPWQGYMNISYFPLLWLLSVQYSEMKNKKLLNIVRETSDMIRNSFDKIFLNVLEGLEPDDWLDEFVAPPRQLKKILESEPFKINKLD